MPTSQTKQLPSQPPKAHRVTPAPLKLRLNRDGTLPPRYYGRRDPDFLAWLEANLQRALAYRALLKREYHQRMRGAMHDVKRWRDRLRKAQAHAAAPHQEEPTR